MNTYRKPARTSIGIVPTLVRCMVLAAPLLLAVASPARAATTCTDTRLLDIRLNSVAEQGVAPFVRFVHRTRTIYQLDVAEALERVAAYRQHAAACRDMNDE